MRRSTAFGREHLEKRFLLRRQQWGRRAWPPRPGRHGSEPRGDRRLDRQVLRLVR
jgi:hypothetical protein